MLINMTPPEVFNVDTMKDIEDNYKQLEGGIVLLIETNTVYAVCPRRKGIGHLIEIYGAEYQWETILRMSERYE